jgi:hypothetical protein
MRADVGPPPDGDSERAIRIAPALEPMQTITPESVREQSESTSHRAPETESRADSMPTTPARRASDGATGATAATGARRGRSADRALGLLLLAAEREDLHVGLTVNVGGVVVSGTLIGTISYYRALADHFASVAGGTEMDERLADGFRDLVDDAADVAWGDRRHPPDTSAYERSIEFLHLADARYISASGLLPLGRHGLLWRCPVADVGGWSLGELAPR